MEIKKIYQDFSVCQVRDYSLANLDSEYSFIGKTDEEKSLVCVTDEVPENTIQREDGWKAFRVQGVLDFSLIGILAKIAAVLADNGISIFAVSTYNAHTTGTVGLWTALCWCVFPFVIPDILKLALVYCIAEVL